jgi:hypothetical protein
MFNSRKAPLSQALKYFVIAAAFAVSATLDAQQTTMTLSGGTVTFPAPTAADYNAGWINSTGGVTYTLAGKGKKVSHNTIVSILSTSTSLGSGKVIADLQWRRSDLTTWNSIMLTDAQVEQKVMVTGGANDPWNNTIFFRMLLSWTTDAPATYSANYQLTLSQTVP